LSDDDMRDAAPAKRGRPRIPLDLTDGPITRTLLAFALPTLASSLLQSLNGAVNSVWVGQLLGTTAVAATTNANLVMFMVFALSFGLSMAISILVGQSMGRRDIDGMRRFVGAGVTLFGIAGLVVAIGGWLAMPAILHSLRTPADVYPLALDYGRISMIGLFPGLMMSFLQSALRGTGDSVTPLRFIIPSTIIDIALNPLLILGWGPVPALGIAGSAIAGLVANAVVLLVLLCFIYRLDLAIRLRGAEWDYLRPSRATIGAIMRRGVPMGLQMVVVTLTSLATVGLINRYGTITVAAYGAANQLWTYVQMPAFAISAAVSTMAAQSIGANRWDRVNRIMISGVWLNFVLTGGLVLIFTLADRMLLGLFLGNERDAVEVARHINLVAGWSLVLAGVGMVVGAVPRANGATVVPLIITFVALVPGRIGLALWLSARQGADGIWWSFPNGYFVSLLLTALYYWHGGWRRIRLLAPAAAEDIREIVAEDEALASRPPA
jgi:putative MATE family efflux protein